MSYKFIISPVDGKLYSIHSELGRNMIKGYLKQTGGELLESIKEPPVLQKDKPTELGAPIEVENQSEGGVEEPIGPKNNDDKLEEPVVEPVKKEPVEENNDDKLEKPVEDSRQPEGVVEDAQPTKVVTLENPIRARLKAQLAPWVSRWENLVELLKANFKGKQEQAGGDSSDYLINVLTLIV